MRFDIQMKLSKELTENELDEKEIKKKSDDKQRGNYAEEKSDEDLLIEMLMKNRNSLSKLQGKKTIDIFNLKFLERLLNDQSDMKLILTVLRCNNLSAVDNYIPAIKDYIKGETSKCSADPFLSIFLGNQQIHDTQPIQDNLNPEFNEVIQRGVTFPADWKLRVEVNDKNFGQIEALDRQTLIGFTEIDIEERRFSDKLYLCKLINQISLNDAMSEYNKFIELDKKMKTINKAEKVDDTKKGKLKKAVKKLEERKIWLRERKLLRPVIEIRQIKKHKDHAQGSIQLITEVLAQNELDKRDIQMERLMVQEQEEYEVRLIIYKVIGCFHHDGQPVSKMFVRGVFAATNWKTEPVVKETETQYGAADGKGVFNWRMKFNFKMPVEFPRIKL